MVTVRKGLDIEGILDDLSVVVVRRSRKRDGSHELHALCPNPKHDDRNPSWSINDVSLKHSCFSCLFSGGLEDLYLLRGQRVPENLSDQIDKASALKALRDVTREVDPGFTPYDVHEWDVRHHYADVPDRLLNLKYLTRMAADVFDVRWDSRERCWVLPIRGPKGDLWGYQFRQKGSHPNTQPEGLAKSETLFGLSAMRRHQAVLVVESPLDSVRCYSVGIPSVATLGAYVTDRQAQLLARHFTKVVIGFDNDRAGLQGAAVLGRMLDRHKTYHLTLDYRRLGDAKDPGEVEDDEALRRAWRDANLLFHW